MTITLDLSPEMEALLRESAARQDAEAVRRVLTDAMAPTVEALLRESASRTARDDEAEILLDRLADQLEACMGSDVAPLPDDAVSRAGIYRNHP